MSKHPSAYEQGLQDGFLIPMVFSLEEDMPNKSSGILNGAHCDLTESRKASAEAGYEEELLVAQTLAAQATAAALISIAERLGMLAKIAESLDMLATTAHDDLERKLRDPSRP